MIIGFDVELTHGIRDSADQQTIWVPTLQYVDGISIAAQSQKDEVVRIPSSMSFHVKEVVILNLVLPNKR